MRSICVILGLAAGAACYGQSLTLIAPTQPGTNIVRLTGVSYDGRLVTGYDFHGSNNPTPVIGFEWSPQSGRVTVHSQGGVLAASGDGASSVGYGVPTGTQYSVAFRHHDGVVEYLGTLPGYRYGFATAANVDASVVVGYSQQIPFSSPAYRKRAFIWREGQGMTDLGALSPFDDEVWAYDVSDDGNMVVGLSSGPGTGVRGFVWTPQTGMQMPSLPAGPNGAVDEVRCVSPDGRFMTGTGGSQSTGYGLLLRWADDVCTPLGRLNADEQYSFALSMSDDGNTVVARTNLWSQSDTVPTIWNSEVGFVTASTFFSHHGVSLPNNFSLLSCTAVSGDGNTFVGYGRFVDENPVMFHGFVVTIPAPASALLFAFAAAAHRRRR